MTRYVFKQTFSCQILAVKGGIFVLETKHNRYEKDRRKPYSAFSH